MSILYRPPDGVAADFIPFYWQGDYHLFYLKDYRDPQGHGEGTPWFHLVTRDFVHFADWGEALARGLAGAQDRWVFTGSVIEVDGTFHIFYTGHNSHFKGTGQPVQAVMHATSPDLHTWAKDRDWAFFAPVEKGYEPDDWRDPFVFWNGAQEEYWMLLAARKEAGPSRHRGLIALATSRDLRNWEVRDPFWAPDLYFTHECPDLFHGTDGCRDWWYLVYSTFSERCVTHYRMSKSLAGPWLAPANDTFDGRAYYAAKTAGDGDQRFVFGWLPTRSGERDDGSWNWGGELVVHQIAQAADGTLTVRPPQTVCDAFVALQPVTPRPVLGQWHVSSAELSATAIGRHAVLMLGEMPQECLVETEVTLAAHTASAGLLLRADAHLEGTYQVRLEPANGRMVFDRWPRPGDQPFVLECPLAITPGVPVRLRLIVDGTCVVVYADDQVALSCRMYDHRQGMLGLFVTEGEATFRYPGVRTRSFDLIRVNPSHP
jgi:beta-fructofuranosidase